MCVCVCMCVYVCVCVCVCVGYNACGPSIKIHNNKYIDANAL